MARTLREKLENLEHTHSKLGIFIEQALPNELKQDWKKGTGKFEAARLKYLQLYSEIWEQIDDKRTITLADKLMDLDIKQRLKKGVEPANNLQNKRSIK